MKNIKITKSTKYLLTALFTLVGILIITRGITYAKYVANAVLNYYLTNKGFYFDSEELSINENKNIDTSWDGDSVYFTLTNSANNTLATEYDIKYKVTCSIEEEDNKTKVCYLNGTNKSTINATLSTNTGCKNNTNDGVDTSSYDEVKCKKDGYTWESIPSISRLYFDVVDTEGNEVDTATVIVKAEAIAPYKKELSAKYTLNKDTSEVGSLSVTYESKNSYENIIITNSYNEDKCIKLTWDTSKLIIDLNEEIQTNKDKDQYINEIIFSLEKKNSKNFIFYKNDVSKNYSENDFNIVESNECK